MLFTLFPSVFFSTDATAAVIYDTKTFVSDTIKTTSTVSEFFNELLNIDNLNTVRISPKNKAICERLCDRGFGVIHNDEDIVESLPPSLTIRNNWEMIKSAGRQTSADVLAYLTDITIFVGGRKDIKENICYQTEYPLPGEGCMDYTLLSSFIAGISRIPKVRMKLVFPYVSEYSGIKEILAQLAIIKNDYKVVVRDIEYYSDRNAREMLKKIESKIIVVNDTRNLCKNEVTGSVINHFLIFDEDGARIAEESVKRHNLSIYSFIAIFDGNNKEFINSSVFPSEQELLSGTYTRNHIFSHQAVNTFYFGHLYIKPDCGVYSDLAKEQLGTIRDSLHSLIINELNSNFSWRRTRYTKSCCQRCRFLYLCPSISPLENSMNADCIRNI